jgi:hypothetical protein
MSGLSLRPVPRWSKMINWKSRANQSTVTTFMYSQEDPVPEMNRNGSPWPCTS